MILFFSIFIIFVIVIKIESHGPIFYSQNYTGQDGRIFPLYKFRTMQQIDSDRSLQSITSFDRTGSAQTNMSNSSRGDGSQTSRSTTPTNVDEATLAYVHRRKQSYTETMQERSLGARFLKVMHPSTSLLIPLPSFLISVLLPESPIPPPPTL